MATKVTKITSFQDYGHTKSRAVALAKQIAEDLSHGMAGGDLENARSAVTRLRSLIARMTEWHKQ